jgi:hypothetical protein
MKYKDKIIIITPEFPEGYGAFDDQDDTGEINLKNIDNIKFDQIDYSDAPEFTDAYIISADHNGVPLTEIQLDDLNENRDFVHQKLIDYLY